MKSLLLALWFAFALAVTALAADIALAADLAQPSGFDSFVTNTLQPLILSLLGLVVTAAVGYLTNLLKNKFGLEISNATNDRLRAVAYDSVMAVEERAAAYLKERGNRIVGETKHSEAIDLILQKVPALSREEADQLVLSAVGMVKGLGASKAVGV